MERPSTGRTAMLQPQVAAGSTRISTANAHSHSGRVLLRVPQVRFGVTRDQMAIQAETILLSMMTIYRSPPFTSSNSSPKLLPARLMTRLRPQIAGASALRPAAETPMAAHRSSSSPSTRPNKNLRRKVKELRRGNPALFISGFHNKKNQHINNYYSIKVPNQWFP